MSALEELRKSMEKAKAINRDVILNMPAGREMDALVAEKIMGWRDIQSFTHETKRADGSIYNAQKTTRGTPPSAGDGTFYHIKNYSTDMSAAWEVVEKLKEQPNGFALEYFYFNSPEVRWSVWFEHAQVTAPTAPLAICRATLLATIGG